MVLQAARYIRTDDSPGFHILQFGEIARELVLPLLNNGMTLGILLNIPVSIYKDLARSSFTVNDEFGRGDCLHRKRIEYDVGHRYAFSSF